MAESQGRSGERGIKVMSFFLALMAVVGAPKRARSLRAVMGVSPPRREKDTTGFCRRTPSSRLQIHLGVQGSHGPFPSVSSIVLIFGSGSGGGELGSLLDERGA